MVSDSLWQRPTCTGEGWEGRQSDILRRVTGGPVLEKGDKTSVSDR